MPKLLVTADIHGSFGAWTTIKELLEPQDHLAIAGDLFDTRYGNPANPDFQPDTIKKELSRLKNPVYYVYGNCDVQAFFPDQKTDLSFNFMGTEMLLHHGHNFATKIPKSTRVVIQGHTHMGSLKKDGRRVFLNPGTIAAPRNNLYTYGIVEQHQAKLINLKTGRPVTTLDL